MFEHNNNLSGPIILLKRMESGVWSVGDIARSVRDIQKVLLSVVWALNITTIWSVIHLI